MRKKRGQALETFGDILMPSEAQEPILAKPVRGSLTEWLEEIWADKDLQEVGITARRKAIFHGGPGTGKTTLAHHLAARLGIRMLCVRPETIIDCYIGSSARNMGELFDTLETEGDGQTGEPLLVFFDEFDSLGMSRMHGGKNQSAEHGHNEMINTLLARMERYEGFMIAATNHAEHLDQAVWRRFDIHIALEVPGADEIRKILKRYLEPYTLPTEHLERLAKAMRTASPALIRQFCENLKRNLVIGPKIGWDMARDACLDRIFTGLQPHPDLGKPELWSLGSKHHAIQNLPWPLLRDVNAYEQPAKTVPKTNEGPSTNVVEGHFGAGVS